MVRNISVLMRTLKNCGQSRHNLGGGGGGGGFGGLWIEFVITLLSYFMKLKDNKYCTKILI
jgi:hypothetical protein